MPYAERNNIGEVVSLHQFPKSDEDEYLEPSDPEILSFMQRSAPTDTESIQQKDLIQALINSDRDVARVTEDLIALLVAKKIIIFTELPTSVQQKVLERENLRKILHGNPDGFHGEEHSLM